MHKLMTPQQIETIAKKNGLTMRQVCEEAGIAFSTFTRWRSGSSEPRIGVYTRVVSAAHGMPVEKEIAA